MSDERGTREAKHCELHGNQLTCAKCVEVASDPDHPMRRNEATAAEPLADWADGVFQAASIVRAEAAQHPGHSSEKLLESLADTLQKVGENYPGIDSGRLTLLLEAADGLAEACDGMHAGGAWPPSYTAFVQVDSARRAYEAERKEWRGRMGRSEARPGGGSRATMPGTRPEVPDEATDQQLIALVVGLPIDTAQTLYDRLVAAWRIGRDRSKAPPDGAEVIALGKSYTPEDVAIATAWATEHPSPSNADLARLIAKVRRGECGRPDAPAGGDK